MKITDSLNSEHAVFLTQLAAIERMLDRSAPAGEVAACALALAEAVEIHRKAEEDLLYPAILRAFGQDFPPIRVMEAEHVEIETHVTGLRARGADVPNHARSLIDVLRRHIGKEIQVLFPMAESAISPADLEAMHAQAAATRAS